MAYVDYKVLESLLIEGEDIIATEGIGSMIVNVFKKLGSVFMKAINVIINCFKKLFAKLKRNKGKTNEDIKEKSEKNYNDIQKVVDDIHKSENSEDFNKLNISAQNERYRYNGKLRDLYSAISHILSTVSKSMKVLNLFMSPRITEFDVFAESMFSDSTLHHLNMDIDNYKNGVKIILSDEDKNKISDRLHDAIELLEATKSKYLKSYKIIERKICEYEKREGDNTSLIKLNADISNQLSKAQTLSSSLLKVLA